MSALAWLGVVAASVVVLAFVVVPRVTGSEPLTVLTGSMRPGLPPGSLVVVRPTPFEDVQVGDVVTYQLRSGEPTLVTHRVVGLDVTPEGPRLRTRGDANAADDPELVRREQLRGTVWYSAPWLGTASTWVDPVVRDWAARGVGAGLIGYAAFVATRLVRDRGSRGEPRSTPSSPPADLGSTGWDDRDNSGGEPADSTGERS